MCIRDSTRAIHTDAAHAARVLRKLHKLSPWGEELVRRGYLTCMEDKEIRIYRLVAKLLREGPGFLRDFSDETLHIYLATGLAQQETERDEDEFIELFTLPLEEAYQQAMRGALPDAKTIAGLAMAHARWTAEHTKGE